MSNERTFIAVKPDGVQRGLTGEIIKRFEAKGFKLVAMKYMQASEEHLKKHYADLSDKPFFAGLVKYMASGPLVAMCWEGTKIVKTARQMMGETNPADSKPGTIRGDFCIEVGRNIIHGSDSVESANKEIALWFKPEELISWTQAAHDWIYEFLVQVGDVTCDQGLEGLNEFLKDKSYINGYIPSKRDLILFNAIHYSINKLKFPHMFRWHKHIKAVYDDIEQSCGKVSTNEEKRERIRSPALQKDVPEVSPAFQKEDASPGFQKDVIPALQEGNASDSKTDSLSDLSNGNVVSEKELRNISVSEKDSDENVSSEVSNVYAILLEIKPKDEETGMAELEDLVRSVALEGLKWGASQLSPVAYGVQKLSIICTVEDDKASIQDVLQKLIKFEDYIRDVNIAAFNKV